MKTEELRIEAKVEALPEAIAFAVGTLTDDCPMRERMHIELVTEEIFVNIASYAYDPAIGPAEVRCEVLDDPLRVVIQFLDHGKPFDPLAREDADTSEEALMERIGGLGILLVKETMDEVSYSYEEGKNILTILKKL